MSLHDGSRLIPRTGEALPQRHARAPVRMEFFKKTGLGGLLNPVLCELSGDLPLHLLDFLFRCRQIRFFQLLQADFGPCAGLQRAASLLLSGLPLLFLFVNFLAEPEEPGQIQPLILRLYLVKPLCKRRDPVGLLHSLAQLLRLEFAHFVLFGSPVDQPMLILSALQLTLFLLQLPCQILQLNLQRPSPDKGVGVSHRIEPSADIVLIKHDFFGDPGPACRKISGILTFHHIAQKVICI